MKQTNINRNDLVGKQILAPGKYNDEIVCTVIDVKDNIVFLKDSFGNKCEFDLSEIKMFN